MAITAAQYLIVAVASIRPSVVALRAVDQEDPKYLTLVQDVGRRGILLPLQVREKTDPTTEESYYELCDGLQRFSAALANGLETVPVKVDNVDDAESEERQLVANLCRIDMRPIDETNHLKRMLSRNPMMTVPQLAEKISQSPSYVTNRLSFAKLDESIQALVNDGEINIMNATALAKLPRSEQHNFTDAAMQENSDTFVPTVSKRAKELRDAAAEGRKANPIKFEATPHLRKLKDLIAALTTTELAAAITSQENSKTAVEGFQAGLKYVVSLDSASIVEAEAKYDQQQADKADAKRKGAAERAAKQAKEVAAKAEKAREEAGLTEEEVEAALAALAPDDNSGE